MARNVAGGFTAAGRVTDVYGVDEIEMFDDCRSVGCVMIHVVSVRHLTRPSMAPAIDTHNPIPLLNEVQHLRIPVVRAERPPVVEHNGLATAPVLIEDLSAVLGGDRAHRFIPRLGLLMPNL